MRADMVTCARQPHGNMSALARAFRVSRQTIAKWVRRAAIDEGSGLADRSSRPHHSPRRLSRVRRRQVERRRRRRWSSIRIARDLGVPIVRGIGWEDDDVSRSSSRELQRSVQPYDQDEHPDHVQDASRGDPGLDVLRQVKRQQEDRKQRGDGQLDVVSHCSTARTAPPLSPRHSAASISRRPHPSRAATRSARAHRRNRTTCMEGALRRMLATEMSVHPSRRAS